MITNKQISAFFLLLCSNLCSAGTMGPSTTATYELGAYALYLHPTFGGNGLGYSTYSNYNGNDNNGVFQGVSGTANPINNILPKWQWGFALEGSYFITPTGDVHLDWYHLRDNTEDNLPRSSLFSGSVDGFYGNKLKLASHWDAVNLEMGHTTPLTEFTLAHLHAGLAYVGISNQFTNYPLLSQTSTLPVFVTVDKMQFHGFGPRVGGDFSYALNHGLHVYAKAASDLLVGKNKQHIQGYQDINTPNYGRIIFGIPNYAQSKTVVIPELEAKLGGTFQFNLWNGLASFDIGYLWMTYLQAIQSYTGVGIVGASVGNKSFANYNLDGLYLGLSWIS